MEWIENALEEFEDEHPTKAGYLRKHWEDIRTGLQNVEDELTSRKEISGEEIYERAKTDAWKTGFLIGLSGLSEPPISLLKVQNSDSNSRNLYGADSRIYDFLDDLDGRMSEQIERISDSELYQQFMEEKPDSIDIDDYRRMMISYNPESKLYSDFRGYVNTRFQSDTADKILSELRDRLK